MDPRFIFRSSRRMAPGASIYRASDGAPWQVLAGLDYAKRTVGLHGLSTDGSTLYLSLVTPDGTWGIYLSRERRRPVAGPGRAGLCQAHGRPPWVEYGWIHALSFARHAGWHLGHLFIARATAPRGRSWPGWTMPSARSASMG